MTVTWRMKKKEKNCRITFFALETFYFLSLSSQMLGTSEQFFRLKKYADFEVLVTDISKALVNTTETEFPPSTNWGLKD